MPDGRNPGVLSTTPDKPTHQVQQRFSGSSARLSPAGAALANGTAGHVLDFDDTSYTGIMHGTAVVFPAALAAAGIARADGRRLLEAFVAGSEVSYSIALLCSESHYHKGGGAPLPSVRSARQPRRQTR